MAKAKKTFIFYNDRKDYVDQMTPEEAWNFLKAILSYQNWDPPLIEWGLKFIRWRIKKQLDEDNQKREEEVEKRRIAGKNWGLARARNLKQNKASAKNFKQVLKKDGKSKQIQADNVNENVNDNENIKGEEKEKYKDFVFLTPSEFQTLKELLGEWTLENYIEDLNNYLGQKWKKYKSHYFTIRNWRNRDQKANKNSPPSENYSSDNRTLHS